VGHCCCSYSSFTHHTTGVVLHTLLAKELRSGGGRVNEDEDTGAEIGRLQGKIVKSHLSYFC
jgi:hypothetical protein